MNEEEKTPSGVVVCCCLLLKTLSPFLSIDFFLFSFCFFSSLFERLLHSFLSFLSFLSLSLSLSLSLL